MDFFYIFALSNYISYKMTLTEYINQKDPQRLGVGEVVLQDSEVQIVRTMKPHLRPSYTIVYIPNINYCYMILERSQLLKTIDQDGNPKSGSVFSYKVPLEK
jgi:formylmethanofuran dehydrogenase subunit D